MHRRVLCAWLPNWPCQRILQSDRSLLGHPFVLQARDPRRGFVVAAASSLARESGILPGMPISEANSLVLQGARPSSLVILEHDPQEEIEAICRLADGAQQFSPTVGLETLDAKLWAGRSLLQPQSLLLDATNLGTLFGGEVAMANRVARWLHSFGYLSCIAIADSVGAAWALANYGMRVQAAQALHTQNLFASEMRKENDEEEENEEIQSQEGIESPAILLHPIVVDRAGSREQSKGLPIEALRLETACAQALRRLGIRRLDELLALPREGLATRLGTKLIDRIDQLWQFAEEPILSFHADPEFIVEQSLEHPTHRRETLEEVVRRLAIQLCQRLLTRGRGGLRVLCRFDGVRTPSIVLQLDLFRATAEVEHLTALLLGQFDRQWERAIEVHRVSLQATMTGELLWQQPSLFEVEQVAHRESVAKLIDGLSSRLGRKAVLAPQIHRDPQPELACSWRPLTGLRSDGKSQTTSRKLSRSSIHAEPQVEDPLRRPLSLLPSPQALEPLSISPDGPPQRFRHRNKTHTLSRYWGPERIESGWWRGPSQRRDYYRIETDEGRWLWIFCQLQDNRWFLHGAFD